MHSQTRRVSPVLFLIGLIVGGLMYFLGRSNGIESTIDDVKFEFGVKTSSEIQQIATTYRKALRESSRLLEIAAIQLENAYGVVEMFPQNGVVDVNVLRQRFASSSMIIEGLIANHIAVLTGDGVPREDFDRLASVASDNIVARNFASWRGAQMPLDPASNLLRTYGDAFLIDLDGDQFKEVLHVMPAYRGQAKTFIFVQSMGDGVESFRTSLQTDFYSNMPTYRSGRFGPYLTDADGDGDVDLVQVNVNTGERIVAKNDGKGVFTDSVQ